MRAKRTDNTQTEIVEALRACGCFVLIVSGVIDLIVWRGWPQRRDERIGRDLFLMDCKTPKSKAGKVQKTAAQEKLDREGWPILYPRSAEEALTAVGIVTR